MKSKRSTSNRHAPRRRRTKSINDVVWRDAGGGTVSTDQVSVRAADAQSKSLAPTEQYELSTAVNAITNNLSKGRFRHFFDTGREITGGPLWELTSFPSRRHRLTSKRFIREIVAWLNIVGEFAVLLQPGEKGWPTEMLPLAPHLLRVTKPARPPNTRADVATWGYRWTDGTEQAIPDDLLFYDRLFNPNPRSIRGLSPLITGGVIVSGAYYAERYNKQFFENNAIPSHIVKLSNGTPKAQRDAFTRQYLATYGNYTNNAHKVAIVTADKDFSVEHLEQSFQDGAFMEMMKRGDLKVGQLYHVPAINMGIYDKTRFDTANEERQLFFEETLEPQGEMIGEAFSQQVTPLFTFAEHTTAKPRMTRSFGTLLEKAMAENPGRRITTVFDTDALPIKHQVMLSRTESAQQMRDTYNMSAQEVVEFIGLDLPPRKEREDVWIENKYVNITHPEFNAALVPGVKPGAGGESDSAAAEKKPAKPAKKQIKAVEALIRKLRRPTFDAAEKGAMWTLAEADAIGGAAMKAPIRRLRHGLRRAIKGSDEPVAAAKEYLNGVTAESLLN